MATIKRIRTAGGDTALIGGGGGLNSIIQTELPLADLDIYVEGGVQFSDAPVNLLFGSPNGNNLTIRTDPADLALNTGPGVIGPTSEWLMNMDTSAVGYTNEYVKLKDIIMAVDSASARMFQPLLGADSWFENVIFVATTSSGGIEIVSNSGGPGQSVSFNRYINCLVIIVRDGGAQTSSVNLKNASVPTVANDLQANTSILLNSSAGAISVSGEKMLNNHVFNYGSGAVPSFVSSAGGNNNNGDPKLVANLLPTDDEAIQDVINRLLAKDHLKTTLSALLLNNGDNDPDSLGVLPATDIEGLGRIFNVTVDRGPDELQSVPGLNPTATITGVPKYMSNQIGNHFDGRIFNYSINAKAIDYYYKDIVNERGINMINIR